MNYTTLQQAAEEEFFFTQGHSRQTIENSTLD
jgi:hypothetical protein